MDASVQTAPPVDEPLMVAYGSFECLAYLDGQGVWHDWFSDRELQNVLTWTALE